MPATQTAEKPNFDTVWAILQETMQIQKENSIGIKELRESQRENYIGIKELRESQRESKDDFYARLGSLTNLFGDFTLGMVAPKLCDKFFDLGYDLHRAIPNYYINDKINKIYLEIDIMLENGDKAMLIEVKTKLTTERINKHIERLEKMRKYADLHGDKRTFLGAVAGFAVTDEVKEYALKEGFYLIEPDGDNFNITPPNDKPKEW